MKTLRGHRSKKKSPPAKAVARARTKPARAAVKRRELQLKKIVVPVDFSEWSIRAVEWAASLAHKLGGELILIYVVERLTYPGDLIAPLAGKEFASSEQKAIADKLLGLTENSGVPARSVVTLGRPWVEICKLARDERADLIVMCKHGTTGMIQAFLGSVAEKVVRHAPCDVLTIKPRGKGLR
jgi:universal stress protein A